MHLLSPPMQIAGASSRGEQERKRVQGAAARRFEATGDEDDDGDRTTGRR